MATYELISTQTVTGATAASIDFTSIPNTWTDLLVKFSLRSDADTGYAYVRVGNGSIDTGSNYKWLRLTGDTAAGSASSASATFTQIAAGTTNSTYTASTFSNAEIYIPNYTSSAAKSISVDAVNETNATGAFRALIAGYWSGTSAITNLSLYSNSGSLVQYSTASLYGIKN